MKSRSYLLQAYLAPQLQHDNYSVISFLTNLKMSRHDQGLQRLQAIGSINDKQQPEVRYKPMIDELIILPCFIQVLVIGAPI